MHLHIFCANCGELQWFRHTKGEHFICIKCGKKIIYSPVPTPKETSSSPDCGRITRLSDGTLLDIYPRPSQKDQKKPSTSPML